MKKNLLPNMRKVKMTDRQGEEFAMWIEVRKSDEQIYVFLSDTHQLGTSKLAQDAVYYFAKISKRLNLEGKNSVFFRHIYQEQMGSLFGQFNVDWENQAGPSYKFQMLTNIDDLQGVSKILDASESVNLQDQVTAREVA